MDRVGASPRTCAIHLSHSPTIAVPGGWLTDEHHIQPLAEGGQDTPENRIQVCLTGHRRMHEMMRLMHRNGGVLPSEWSVFPRVERDLARRGYDAAMAWRRANGVRMDKPMQAA